MSTVLYGVTLAPEHEGDSEIDVSRPRLLYLSIIISEELAVTMCDVRCAHLLSTAVKLS